MKKLILLFIFLSLTSQFAFADDSLDKVEAALDKYTELAEKYEKAEINFVKKEDVTITDQNGEGQACEMLIYYKSGKVIQLKTGSDGKFSGDFKHFKVFPIGVQSYKMWGCPCKIKSVEHDFKLIEIEEQIEKVKQVINEEIASKSKDKAKEFVEEALDRALDSKGTGTKLGGIFMAGFDIGTELGQPFSDAMQQGLTKILDAQQTKNKKQMEDLEGADALVPAGRVYSGQTARWAWTNFMRQSPNLKNTWDFNVRCDANRYGTGFDTPVTNWISPPQYRPTVSPTPPTLTGASPGADSSGADAAEAQAAENAAAEAARVTAEAEAKAKEAEEKAKKEQAELAAKIKKIKETCFPCNKILDKIELKRQEILDKIEDIKNKEIDQANAESDLTTATRKQTRAKRELDRFNNPRSSVSSGNRRVDSSDLEARREISRDLWSEYGNGDLSAQELSDAWRDISPADIAAKKQQLKEAKEAALKAAKEAADAAKTSVENAQAAVSQAQADKEKLELELENLKIEYEECLKTCKEKPQLFLGADVTWEDIKIDLGQPADTDADGIADSDSTQDPPTPGTGLDGRIGAGSGEDNTENCEATCTSLGAVVEKPNFKQEILAYLNQNLVCRSSAKITYKRQKKDCKCYKPVMPTITSEGDILTYESKYCGLIQCGQSVECSCGPRCTANAALEWIGWVVNAQGEFEAITEELTDTEQAST